jgi:serine protease DegS
MRISKNLLFIFQFVTIGLAIAFVAMYLYPELVTGPKPVVELTESTQNRDDANQTGMVSYAAAVKQAAPAVVNIYTSKIITERANPFFSDPFFRRFFGDELGRPRQRQETSLGSGVIVSTQGYILTNNHVISGAQEIAVAFHDGRSGIAKLVGADPESDLAVLKVDSTDLPAITLGRSSQIRVGDVVLAIGNPFGVGQTVTSGIVSALGRHSLGINTFENFIQTDAAINPGNSGGALINAYGELIGINTAIFSESGGSQGIGFAIPIDLARDVLTQIIEQGRVVRGWLGVQIQDINPRLAESFGLSSDDGVVITNIIINGPADKAGLDRGDVITHIDDEKIIDFRDALDRISKYKPGQTITLTVVREGKVIEKNAKVIERPTQEL